MDISQKAPLAAVVTTTRTLAAIAVAKVLGAWKESATHPDKVAKVAIVVVPKDILFLQAILRIFETKQPMNS